ncbi:hypothetical protein [Streptomyces sp. NPDC025273]|uniref:hypothetical protein n=1 Tax=Streptomyces sp. NPDC025273 TaxID=3155251 RepID=UPI0033CEC254
MITKLKGTQSLLIGAGGMGGRAVTSGADALLSAANGGLVEGRRLHGYLGTVTGLALAVLTAMLLGRSWSACDVGVNNAANSGFLLWIFIPGLWTVLLLVWVAVSALLGTRPLVHAFALAVALLGCVWCVISFFWEGSSAPSCPSGVPPWWPSFIPAPGF